MRNYFHFRKARTSAQDAFDLYRAPALGGTPQIIVRDIDSNATFSPDGKQIAYVRANDPEVGKFQILVANADGTDEKMIAGGPVGCRALRSSPGRRMASASPWQMATRSRAQFNVLDVASGKAEDFAAPQTFVFNKSVWLPDGRGLLVQYQDLSAGLNHNQIGFVSYPERRISRHHQGHQQLRVVDALRRCKNSCHRSGKTAVHSLRHSGEWHDSERTQSRLAATTERIVDFQLGRK